MKAFCHTLSGCFITLFLSSCFTNQKLVISPPSKLVSVSEIEKTEIVGALKQKSNISFIRAMLDTEIKSRAGRDNFLQSLTFKSPELFRLEAFATGANALVFIAVSDGKEFKALIPGEKKVLLGKPSIGALSELIQIPVTPRELVALVTGTIFPEFVDQQISIKKSVDGTLFLTAKDQLKRELRLLLEGKDTLRIRELSLSEDGSGALNVHYLYQMGALKVISVKLPDIEGQVEVKEVKYELANPISIEKLFTINQPVSYSVRHFD